MRAAVFYGPRSIEVADRPDPVIFEPTRRDRSRRARLRMRFGPLVLPGRVAACSRVDRPRVHRHRRGHRSEVDGIAKGELVVAPFVYCDMTCPHCLAGVTSHCLAGGSFGNGEIDGGQGEAVRVPLAGSSLIPVPGSPSDHSDETLRSLLALSDVMCTGHHAAVCGRVAKGDTVAVVGDGAVGLSAVLASKRLGAERIIALSRNPVRQQVAREFGATDILAERGDEAIAAVLELTNGIGVDAALECVGTGPIDDHRARYRPSRLDRGCRRRASRRRRPVRSELLAQRRLARRCRAGPGVHPELLDDVLSGVINPGGSSITKPASTKLSMPTRRWTNDVRSSRSCASGRSDGQMERGRA